MQLETSEPITITAADNGNMVVVKVDGMDYAVIDNITIDELDAKLLVEWVNETYYDYDFSSNEICRLNSRIFKKREV